MFRAPGETGLSGRPLALYELIYQRTLASVMVLFFFFFITLGLELSDTKVYEP